MTHTQQHDGELRSAARHFGRRRFLTVTGAAAALAFAVNLPAGGAASAAELNPARITENPFTLGVASGDPLPGSVLLWTRLAPRSFEADGGLPRSRVAVRWELAHDERFTRTVRRGTVTAHPEFQHRVHVEIDHALGRDSARADFRTVSAVTTPGAPVATAGSYVTEVGDPGLKPV